MLLFQVMSVVRPTLINMDNLPDLASLGLFRKLAKSNISDRITRSSNCSPSKPPTASESPRKRYLSLPTKGSRKGLRNTIVIDEEEDVGSNNHLTNGRRRRVSYTTEEDVAILDYLVSRNLVEYVIGSYLWLLSQKKQNNYFYTRMVLNGFGGSEYTYHVRGHLSNYSIDSRVHIKNWICWLCALKLHAKKYYNGVLLAIKEPAMPNRLALVCWMNRCGEKWLGRDGVITFWGKYSRSTSSMFGVLKFTHRQESVALGWTYFPFVHGVARFAS